jgi:hypothetical protein
MTRTRTGIALLAAVFWSLTAGVAGAAPAGKGNSTPTPPYLYRTTGHECNLVSGTTCSFSPSSVDASTGEIDVGGNVTAETAGSGGEFLYGEVGRTATVPKGATSVTVTAVVHIVDASASSSLTNTGGANGDVGVLLWRQGPAGKIMCRGQGMTRVVNAVTGPTSYSSSSDPASDITATVTVSTCTDADGTSSAQLQSGSYYAYAFLSGYVQVGSYSTQAQAWTPSSGNASVAMHGFVRSIDVSTT